MGKLLNTLEVKARSYSTRLKKLAEDKRWGEGDRYGGRFAASWDEGKHSRGKTTPGSRGGSFAPSGGSAIGSTPSLPAGFEAKQVSSKSTVFTSAKFLGHHVEITNKGDWVHTGQKGYTEPAIRTGKGLDTLKAHLQNYESKEHR